MTADICDWPSCKAKATMPCGIEIDLPPQNENEPTILQRKFCKYHFFIASGQHFELTKTTNYNYVMTGPFGTVKLIESVMAARELTRIDQPRTKEEIQAIKGRKRT